MARRTPPPAPPAARRTGYVVHAPAAQTVPLVLSSPHSGRSYAEEFMSAARLDEATLRRSEDSYVDEIFAAAPALGAPLIAATFRARSAT